MHKDYTNALSPHVGILDGNICFCSDSIADSGRIEPLPSLSATLSKEFAKQLDKLAAQKTPVPEFIREREKNGKYYTTVKWTDGTYTTVKVSKDDEAGRSTYMAFCAALAKKLYGSNCAVHRIVNTHTVEYLQNKHRQEDKEKKLKLEEVQRIEHERAVLKEAKRLRLKAEAKAYNAAHRYDEE